MSMSEKRVPAWARATSVSIGCRSTIRNCESHLRDRRTHRGGERRRIAGRPHRPILCTEVEETIGEEDLLTARFRERRRALMSDDADDFDPLGLRRSNANEDALSH